MNEHPSMDQLLLDSLNEAIQSNLQNEQFGVPEIAMAAGLSKSQLNRKLQNLTGQSASQFIREYRLKKAFELLQSNAATSSEVSYMVGFGSPAYFSTCFKDFYGYPPSEVKYRENTTNQKKTKSTWKKFPVFSFGVMILVALAYISFHSSSEVINDESDYIILEKSIAILPFKNLSNNQEDQILADAVREEISRHLQRLPTSDISLRSSTSTEQYRNSNKSIIEIGEELNVNYILQASFQKIGDTANLAVQLINTRTDDHIWAEEFSRDWTDIFNVQREVSKTVANQLSATFTTTAQKAMEKNPTNSMEAYGYYIQGLRTFRSYWRRSDTSLLVKSEQLFNKALKLDKKFSNAHAGLAKVNMQYASMSNGSSKEKLLKTARKYLRKAIKYDPYNGLAYSELATFQWAWEWDSIAARDNFSTALMLEPNNYYIYDSYFQFEFRLGNCSKLESFLKGMARLNPYVSNPFHVYPLKVLTCQKKYMEIANIADEHWNDNFTVVNSRLFFFGYLYTNNYAKAREMVNHVKDKSRRQNQPLRLMGRLSAAEGDSTSTLAYIDSLGQLSKKQYVAKVYIAGLYAAVGDKDNMYRNLDLALSNTEREIRFIRNNDLFIPYQKEKRFQEIWAKAWSTKNQRD